MLSTMQWLLWYDVSSDYLARRGEFREAHLQLARQATAQGILNAGGALTEHDGDSPCAAALYFQTDNRADIEAFVAADPYVQHGLVSHYRILRWSTVAGCIAEQQL